MGLRNSNTALFNWVVAPVSSSPTRYHRAICCSCWSSPFVIKTINCVRIGCIQSKSSVLTTWSGSNFIYSFLHHIKVLEVRLHRSLWHISPEVWLGQCLHCHCTCSIYWKHLKKPQLLKLCAYVKVSALPNTVIALNCYKDTAPALVW